GACIKGPGWNVTETYKSFSLQFHDSLKDCPISAHKYRKKPKYLRHWRIRKPWPLAILIIARYPPKESPHNGLFTCRRRPWLQQFSAIDRTRRTTRRHCANLRHRQTQRVRKAGSRP